jgi:hypothetical protein
LERRETVDWWAGEEEEGSARPKAFAAAMWRMSDMGVLSVESVFANMTIAILSSWATVMDVDTPSAPPSCVRIC